MREIKFRAWDKKNKEWLGVDMGYADAPHGPISVPVVFNGQGECEIMQFTGLHDKNGEEIYEGDICQIWLEYNSYGDEKPHNLEVKWNTEAARFDIGDEAPEDWSEELEVIGNIYENPELLK